MEKRECIRVTGNAGPCIKAEWRWHQHPPTAAIRVVWCGVGTCLCLQQLSEGASSEANCYKNTSDYSCSLQFPLTHLHALMCRGKKALFFFLLGTLGVSHRICPCSSIYHSTIPAEMMGPCWLSLYTFSDLSLPCPFVFIQSRTDCKTSRCDCVFWTT